MQRVITNGQKFSGNEYIDIYGESKFLFFLIESEKYILEIL